jgi:hypothetical protein
MFSTYDGQTLRPPIAWCEDCQQFQITDTYALCLTTNSIKVYSLSDSKLKQDISLPRAKSIKYIKDDRFSIITMQNQICAIIPASLASICAQVDSLLEKSLVEDAFSLLESFSKEINSKIYDEVLKIIFI